MPGTGPDPEKLAYEICHELSLLGCDPTFELEVVVRGGGTLVVSIDGEVRKIYPWGMPAADIAKGLSRSVMTGVDEAEPPPGSG